MAHYPHTIWDHIVSAYLMLHALIDIPPVFYGISPVIFPLIISSPQKNHTFQMVRCGNPTSCFPRRFGFVVFFVQWDGIFHSGISHGKQSHI